MQSGIQRLPCPSWMAQPFNPHLAQKGELSAYVVGSILEHTTHTRMAGQGEFQSAFVDNYTPLHLLQ